MVWGFFPFNIKLYRGTFLAVQWLRLQASTAGGVGSIPDWGTKIPRAPQHGKKKKKNLLYQKYFHIIISSVSSHLTLLGTSLCASSYAKDLTYPKSFNLDDKLKNRYLDYPYYRWGN